MDERSTNAFMALLGLRMGLLQVPCFEGRDIEGVIDTLKKYHEHEELSEAEILVLKLARSGILKDMSDPEEIVRTTISEMDDFPDDEL